jgi:hypothetical protein
MLVPQLITSLGEFERTFGSGAQLDYNGARFDNFLWHAVRAFFENGGKRVYVQRVYRRREVAPGDVGTIVGKKTEIRDDQGNLTGYYDEGVGYAQLPDVVSPIGGATNDDRMFVEARFPGVLGNLRVRFTLNVGQNMLGFDETRQVSVTLADLD